MRPSYRNKHVFPLALLLLGLIVFGFFLLGQTGLLRLAIISDKSMISWVILAIYAVASTYWLRVAWLLDLECRLGEKLLISGGSPSELEEEDTRAFADSELEFLARSDESATDKVLENYAETLENRHASGQFLADLLLKLGLLGTIIGFILMLTPIGEIKEFDPSLIQQLLSTMSGGMAVALYTTLAGLLTSSLLKIQYYFLDSVLVSHVNELTKRFTRAAKIDPILS